MSSEGDEKRRGQLGMEPTIPATEVKGGLPDFSSERSAPDDGGGGRSMPWVIGALVVGVAGVFWWMSPKSVPTAPTSAVATPVAPVATPPAKPAAKPAATKPAAPVPAPPAVPAVPAAPAASAPVPNAPATPAAPSVVAAKPSAPPAHHKRPHHKKASAKTKPVKLPRLPSPPPAD